MGFVYCLYSTEDGQPRYVGRASDKVSYRFKQHVTAALERQPGRLYEWMAEVWRRGHDVNFYVLQEGIAPVDIDMFEQYWIDQFASLLNVTGNASPGTESVVGRQVREALAAQVSKAKETRSP